MRPFPTAAILFVTLIGRAIGGPSVEIKETPMYGETAVLAGGPQQIEVALPEGGRIVSWRINGREIGFVGRIWGGDMSDSLALGRTSVGLRFQRPTEVALLQTEDMAAVRVTMIVPFENQTVSYQRVIGIDTETVFLETNFPELPRTEDLRYTFGAQFIRQPQDGEPVHLMAPDGSDFSDHVLESEAMRAFQFPENRPADPDCVRCVLGLLSPSYPEALVLQVFGKTEPGLHVWQASFQLDISGRPATADSATPIRFRAMVVPREKLADCLKTPGRTWKPVAGIWKPAVLKEETEDKCPQPPSIVVSHGRYGACCAEPAFMAPLAAGGLGWVRVGAFSWAGCEAEQGQIDWSRADAAMAAVKNEGLAVIGEMHGTPGWAAVRGDRRAPPRDWAQWENHVERTVERYRDDVHVWEIWNEPDIGQFFQGTVQEYVHLLASASKVARKADPSCLIMSAGLDGFGEDYLVRMLENGAGDYCDLIGAHPYARDADTAVLRIKIMRRILSFFHTPKPLWITEVGWQSGGWKGGPGVVADEETKARRLREAFPGLQEYADVVCWYRAVEAGSMYGLMQPAGRTGFRLQPAWYTMRDMALAPDPLVAISAPESIQLRAGERSRLSARVENRGTEPLSARWVGAEAAWGATETATVVPPESSAEIAMELVPEIYIRPHDRELILVVQRGHRHTANAVLTARILNSGHVCEPALSGDWIRKLDQDGEAVGKWTPAHTIAIAPGEGFIQPLRPKNLGNEEEKMTLTVTGTAAGWLEPFSPTVTVSPGKAGWIGLHVRVSKNATPGTYTLEAVLRSVAFPEATATFTGSYTVARPENGQ